MAENDVKGAQQQQQHSPPPRADPRRPSIPRILLLLPIPALRPISPLLSRTSAALGGLDVEESRQILARIEAEDAVAESRKGLAIYGNLEDLGISKRGFYEDIEAERAGKETVVVTGASSFLAGHVIEQLVRARWGFDGWAGAVRVERAPAWGGTAPHHTTARPALPRMRAAGWLPCPGNRAGPAT